jgi:hypothetical protein
MQQSMQTTHCTKVLQPLQQCPAPKLWPGTSPRRAKDNKQTQQKTAKPSHIHFCRQQASSSHAQHLTHSPPAGTPYHHHPYNRTQRNCTSPGPSCLALYPCTPSTHIRTHCPGPKPAQNLAQPHISLTVPDPSCLTWVNPIIAAAHLPTLRVE